MKRQLALLSLFFTVVPTCSAGQICSFIPTSSQEETIDEIRAKYDVVVIARRLNKAESKYDESSVWSAAEFQILDELKEGDPQPDTTFVAPCRKADCGREVFLLAGVHSKPDSTNSEAGIRWKIAKPISVAFRHHAMKIAELKATDANRLKFYREFLMDSDEDVSSNASLQLTIAPDDEFATVSAGMDSMVLRTELGNSDLSPYLQRLYLAMLAHCGNEVDANWLKTQIVKRSESFGLEAWIGCYLALAGQEGFAIVDRQFSQTPKPSFIDRYAVLLALRYVRDQHPAGIPRAALLKSFRKILDVEELVDLVIADLAYLKDWESLDRLVGIYQEVDTRAIRTQVVNFVRVCPLPRATEALKQLRQIDAAAVKRAEQFWLDKTAMTKPRHNRIRIIYRGISAFRC